MWSVLVPDIRVRALRLMLIRICLVMKTSLQPNKPTKFFAELSVPIRCQQPVSSIEFKEQKARITISQDFSLRFDA